MTEFMHTQQNNSSSEWKCSSCSAMNKSDRNIVKCNHCYNLDSDINLKRAQQLYMLGNIAKPSVSLIPIKTAFFVYPLSPPMITHTINYSHKNANDANIYFNVQLWDSKHFESYHLKSIKVEHCQKTTIICSKTPYDNTFCLRIQNYKNGVQTFDVYANIYNSERVSPKTEYKLLLGSALHNLHNRKRKLDTDLSNMAVNTPLRKKNKTNTSHKQRNERIDSEMQSMEIELIDQTDTNPKDENVQKSVETSTKWYKWYWIDDNGRKVEGEW